MGSISKWVLLLLVVILTASSLTMVESANAQSIPKPSVPEFTVEFVNASYSVTTTNPYTGANETQQISNNSIKITINNQPFDNSNNQIYYNVRAKPHFTENWTEIYPIQNRTSSYNEDGTFSYVQYINADSSSRSSSSYTTIAFAVVATEYYSESGYDIQRYYAGEPGQEGRYFAFLHGIPDNAQIDFQVEALLGHGSQKYVNDHPLAPYPIGHYELAIAFDTASGWSNAQTITIGEISSPTLSSSPTPSQEPPQTEPFPTTLVIVSIVSVAVTGIGLLVYFKKRKREA